MICHFVVMNFHVIHVGYVQFFHRWFPVLMNVYVRIHLDENIVVLNEYETLVKVDVIELFGVLYVVSMDSIIHNSQDMFLLYMAEYDDVRHVGQFVVELKRS